MLLTTFGLTVLTDLTIAVGVGMVLAAMLFMKRMIEVTNVGALRDELERGDSGRRDDPNAIARRDIPQGVEVYEINGPFFFGVADRLKDTLRRPGAPAEGVHPAHARASRRSTRPGMHALDEFHDKCRRQGTRLLLAGVHAQPMFAMTQYGLLDKIGEQNMFGNIDDALKYACEMVGAEPRERPAGAVAEVARQRTSSPD